MEPPVSVAGVCDVATVIGPRAASGRFDLLLEVPHGADRETDFTSLRDALKEKVAPDLLDFFFVNTDVGAAALAAAVAERFVTEDPTRAAVVVTSRIPRTLIDCNRVIEADAVGASSAAGAVTPGLPPWIQDPADRDLLLGRYAAYRDVTEAAFRLVCGTGGVALMVHSYAPRSLDVPVDENIVATLRREYRPENIERWPLRPAVDLIATDPDGEMLASAAMVAAARRELGALELDVATSEAYSLLPGTMAAVWAHAYPGQTLCLEVRRELLVGAFTPFQEMVADPTLVAPIAGALARAVAESMGSS